MAVGTLDEVIATGHWVLPGRTFEAATAGKGDASRMMNWEEGHRWETGMHLIAGPLLEVFATPKRMIAYLHRIGVTSCLAPGALAGTVRAAVKPEAP